MDNIYFISGIDTGCGKTYITGILAKYLYKSGIKVITQKLVQTGCVGLSEDILEHRRLMECDIFADDKLGLTCPYVFKFPASPYLAAKLEYKIIDINILEKTTYTLTNAYNVVLIEGAGGLHVPLTENLLIIDYIKQQNYRLILVASSKLGSINHTLLSVESCHNHDIKLHSVIYNRLPESDEIIANDTFHVLEKYVKTLYPTTKIIDLIEPDVHKNVLDLFRININNLK